MLRRTRSLALLSCGALAAAVLAQVGPSAAAIGEGDAVSRLRADASGAVRIVSEGSRFVGTPSGGAIANPAVSESDSVSEAARSHLARYGAAVGAGTSGSQMREHRVLRTDIGAAVRYRQEVGGLPVVGGDIVVSMDRERRLVSMLSTTSAARPVPSATLSVEDAADLATAVVARDRSAQVESRGRWLLDPEVIGLPVDTGPRGVWRLTVTDGVDLDREVFLDDRSGAPLLVMDNRHTADRIVCDLANVPQNPNLAEPPCTTPVRSEGQGPTGVADVDSVYAFMGATAELFGDIGVDLTELIGKDVGGTPKLAATVRLCYSNSCPYANAFWNGTEMYYGTGLATDDITGHELAHGVTDRTSELLYWGQSGAINESMSDVFGEIVDHREPTAGDTAADFRIGEDSSLGAIRDMADPNAYDHPARTQDPLWFDDLGDGWFYDDNGGVHFNSGVGNKAAHLIMDGGSFNGQVVTGIDGSNEDFPKTARLYHLVNQTLSSGADYADLGRVLEQSCTALVGSFGFTSADCANVVKAVTATELAVTPANAAQPADADTRCPPNHRRTVLLDSETGSPATKFSSPAANWGYGEDPYWGSNAHSGRDSWHNATPFSSAGTTPRTESLTATAAVAVPTTGTTYLSFHSWHVLDFTINNSGAVADRYDAATVEIDDVGDGDEPIDAAALPWVHGPSGMLTPGSGNPAEGRLAFTDDSRGWVGRRLDLTGFAGTSVKPQFSVHYDNAYSYIGLFVDDITIYTCQLQKVTAGTVTVAGKTVVGKKLTAKPSGWGPAGVALTYQWLRSGAAIDKATGVTYKLTKKDKRKKISVRVSGTKADHVSAVATSPQTGKVKKPKKK